MYDYLIKTLKNKKDITPVCDVIDSNRAFHQLVKNWQLWQCVYPNVNSFFNLKSKKNEKRFSYAKLLFAF